MIDARSPESRLGGGLSKGNGLLARGARRCECNDAYVVKPSAFATAP